MTRGLPVTELSKRVALDKGYAWMEWTFDPLEARNATLNLRRLGAHVLVRE